MLLLMLLIVFCLEVVVWMVVFIGLLVFCLLMSVGFCRVVRLVRLRLLVVIGFWLSMLFIWWDLLFMESLVLVRLLSFVVVI